MSTDAADTTAAPSAATWRLDTDNGSMAPRSALDVLVDLNDKVTTGKVGEYQPVPLGFTPLDKTIGTGLRAGELLLIGGAQGTGKTTMALQMARNVASGGQANVLYICFEHDEQYLLNRLIAMESALAHLPHKTGAIKIQDVRKEILGTWMAEGGGAAQLANNPRLRPSLDRIARYGQNLFLHARLADGQHDRQHPQARPAAPRAVGRPAAGGLRRLPAEGAADPGAGERDREGHLRRQRPQGHRPVRGRADDQHRRRRQGGPQGVAPAQLPPARLVGDQLRGRHHPDPQREVPHRRQGQHRVQPVPGAALPRLGVVSVEKNRGGQDNVDLEFEKHFEFSCFDPNGRTVQEKLIEERLYND